MFNQTLRGLEPPFYLLDLQKVVGRYRDFYAAFANRFERVVIGYSYKTNYVPAMLHALHGAGAWAEVVSELEYRLARRLGVPGERIVFNGPGKSRAALANALADGALVNLDSEEEAGYVLDWKKTRARSDIAVGIRINLPHPEGEGHRARSRFGIPRERLTAVVAGLRAGGVRLAGLHAHLSSRARDERVFAMLTAELCDAARLVGMQDLDYIDVGGGFGYAPADMSAFQFPSFASYAAAIHAVLADKAPDLLAKRIFVEPGIAICTDAFACLAPVLAVKEIAGRRLLFVDGSVHTVKPTRHRHNLPVTLLDADFQPKHGRPMPVDIVGYTCMDDDYLGIGQDLPPAEVGDILRFDNVGAYTLVFKPPFIRTMPAIYAQNGDEAHLVRTEQTFEEFFAGYAMEARGDGD